MIRLPVFFLVVLSTISAFAVPLKRTVQQVENDISNIASQVTSLDQAIAAFPNSGGSLSGALAIHTGANKLVSALKTTTDDVRNTGEVSEADAQKILKSIEAIEPTINDALTQIAAKRPAFDALPISGAAGIAKQDLNNMNSAASELANALVEAAPVDLKSPATLRDRLTSDFNPALAAFADA